MHKDRKRALAAAYKERKKRAGVFAVLCKPTGQRWASASADLDSQQNSVWFGLRLGSFPNRDLQAAWTTHGEDAFAYEVAAELPEGERSSYALRADLKALEEEVRARLNATRVTG